MFKFLRKINFFLKPKKDFVKHNEEKIYGVQKDLIFQVYWKSLSIGKGPAVILKAFDKEILKFDCLGKDRGHYHIAPYYHFRIYFIEETVQDQIKRSLQELRTNGMKYLALQKDQKIKDLKVDIEQYKKILDLVERKLISFHFNIQKENIKSNPN